MKTARHQGGVDRVEEPAQDLGAGDDLDHFTCCDPAYYLATDRPVYAMCGHKLAQGEVIKLNIDDARLCRLCLDRVRSLGEDESPCERLCPRLLFG